MMWCTISYLLFGIWLSFKIIMYDKETDIGDIKNKKVISEYTMVILCVTTAWLPLGLFMIGSAIWEIYHEKP